MVVWRIQKLYKRELQALFCFWAGARMIVKKIKHTNKLPSQAKR
jgi:hypothetical protein